MTTETYVLVHYFVTHLKEKSSHHISIEIFYKFPLPLYRREVEKQLKSCGKINAIINRQGSKILFTEKKCK